MHHVRGQLASDPTQQSLVSTDMPRGIISSKGEKVGQAKAVHGTIFRLSTEKLLVFKKSLCCDLNNRHRIVSMYSVKFPDFSTFTF